MGRDPKIPGPTLHFSVTHLDALPWPHLVLAITSIPHQNSKVCWPWFLILFSMNKHTYGNKIHTLPLCPLSSESLALTQSGKSLLTNEETMEKLPALWSRMSCKCWPPKFKGWPHHGTFSPVLCFYTDQSNFTFKYMGSFGTISIHHPSALVSKSKW